MKRIALGTALVLALVLAACTSGDDNEPGAKAPKVEALEPAWSTDVAITVEHAWEMPSALVVASNEELVSLHADTGKEQWRLDLPASLCAWPTTDGDHQLADPSDDGMLALLLPSRAPGKPCRDVALVDLNAGKLKWRVEVSHPVTPDYKPARFDHVSAGERAVAVTDSTLGGIVRLSVRDGAVLSERGLERYSRAVSDGDHIAAFVRRLRPDATQRIAVLNQDTGKQVATYNGRDSYRLYTAIRSPLVLATTGGHGGSYLFSGRSGTLIGRGQPVWAGIDGKRLVSVFYDAVIVSDLATGKEVSAAPLRGDVDVVGINDGSLVIQNAALAEVADGGTTLQRIDLNDLGSQHVLGRVSGHPLGMVGGRVLVADESTVMAIDAPAEGPELSRFIDVLAWESNDLRPDDVFDACLAVTDETRKGAGVDPTGPVVGSCEWGSGEQFRVTVDAMLPEEGRSAVTVADNVVNHYDNGIELSDVGDRAYINDPKGLASLTEVTVRYRNVVVSASVTSWAHDRDIAAQRVALVAAAEEVLAEIERRAADD